MYDIGIINGKVFIDGKYNNVNIYIEDEIISLITKDYLDAKTIYDCENNLVIPGIIDPHTHFELDLKTTSSKDDFYTGSISAIYGGVTTIIDFIDPVDNAFDLEANLNKRINQAKKSLVDFKFHACLKNPEGNINEIVKKMNDLNLSTVKLFTTYSDSLRRTYDKEIRELLTYSKTNNFLVTAHCEDDEQINIKNTYQPHDINQSRPSSSETDEAVKLAKMVEETNGNLYMVHLSSGNTIKKLVNDFPQIINKNFKIESCPHYFLFNKSKYKKQDNYLYLMAPPLRSKKEQNILKKYINNIDVIGTDHCPFNSDEKNQKLLKDIPFGIGGVEHSFDVMYSLYKEAIIDKMTLNVARIHNLYPRKGIIKEGSDADMFIYKLKKKKIKEDHSQANYTVYHNTSVLGEVVTTLIRGKFVLKDKVLFNNVGKYVNEVK